MARSAAAEPAPDTVEGSLRFLAPMAHKPSIQVTVPGAASHITMAESHYVDRPVQIHNARAVRVNGRSSLICDRPASTGHSVRMFLSGCGRNPD